MLTSVTGLVNAQDSTEDELQLYGEWITEPNGDVMVNPQTSGLVLWRNQLLTLSDGSADQSQVNQLHQLHAENAKLSDQHYAFTFSDQVKQSCFYPYLADKPDYEALAIDAHDDSVFYVVTEDATRAENTLSNNCAFSSKETGSTDYPTLLLRLQLTSDTQLVVTHVRPLRFSADDSVGNFPNDGIEGLAMASDGTLYLGLEKDAEGQPRIFRIGNIKAQWQSGDFLPVEDAKLKVPKFAAGAHPINGMDVMTDLTGHEWIVAAARNDNELWFIDTRAQRDTHRVKLAFWAPTRVLEGCDRFTLMDNASLEGVAVSQDKIWLINDPWKVNYLKNATCKKTEFMYKQFAPLLFSVDRAEMMSMLQAQ
ncbi:esterase-like activity of phytase family protein [Aestuariibacter sp. AA17]|uniref:Esterase-like activity of phytase family protein n=1 Tax=Fluctibacter corallii TaxID=2984329 RepID=A0ABT3A7M8_9ALTE|nr:esterase-like activity of phytase family protein [Aestuariibacter sp. AA17]MCV2884685.1 esterase-like activity of phytase family protein [Aestuariibacter sp. AA17]